MSAYKPAPLTEPDQFDSDKFYTLWQQVCGHWVVERTFTGSYCKNTDLLEEVRKSQQTSRPFALHPRGAKPDQFDEDWRGDWNCPASPLHY